MKVSILVPVYKVEKYIEECARSLFEQTYDDIEYVFVDDCSPDNSIERLMRVANEYPKRLPSVKIIRNEVNKGIGETRGILLDNATGNYVINVDSDDYIDRSAIEKFVRTVETTGADIVRQNYYEVTNGGTEKICNTPFKSKENLIANTIRRNTPSFDALWKLFVRRSVFTNHDIIYPKINWCEDWVLSFQIFYYADKVVDIDDAFYYYRRTNSDSICHNLPTHDGFVANEMVKSILIDKGDFRKYEDDFFYNTFIMKAKYLINKSMLNLDLYTSYHPEVNHLWRQFNYGKREKILFWLAEHKLTFVVRIILHGAKTKSERNT